MILDIPFYKDAWQQYYIPVLTEDDYGLVWPDGVDQLTKELKCFGYARAGIKIGNLGTCYEHGLRAIQLIWEGVVDLYKDVEVDNGTFRIYNDYFFKSFRLLCSGKHVCLTGPASAAKTYTVAIYALLCFYSTPSGTMVMISTTSGAASERRIWKDIKRLHNRGHGQRPGSIIEYLKALTFDPGKEFAIEGEKSKSQRDLSNGVIVIPIPADSKAEGALDTIMGTKNDNVVWIVDELPAMREGIDEPRDNLESNPFFQFIGIGNANRKSDPHGLICEPEEGWDHLNEDRDRIWKSPSCYVLFLHGEESPNDHPILQDKDINDKREYPFPYLSNPIARYSIALRIGRGDITLGKSSAGYYRFGKGFWFGDNMAQTIMSAATIVRHKADELAEYWNHSGPRAVAGFDAGFTSGGDDNALMIGYIGRTLHGSIQIAVDSDTYSINPVAGNREEYRTLVATEVVRICKEKNIQPKDFHMDISNDGGLMMRAIMQEWKNNTINGISSNEIAMDKEHYKNKVTELWYQVLNVVMMGVMKGFNTNSEYARDLFARMYVSHTKDIVEVERKRDMKKRIRRSPDNGDAFTYMIEGMRRTGLLVIRHLNEGSSAEKVDESNRFDGFDINDFMDLKKRNHSDFSRKSLVESY